MKNNDGRIKYSQTLFLVAGFIHGSYFLLSFMDNLAKHDFFLVIISAFVFSIPLFWCYSKLIKTFPNNDLIQILEMVYGKIAGRIIAAFYVLYFFLILALNLKDLAAFYTAYLLTETPMLIFIVAFTLLCAYAVKKGIHTIARISFLSIVFGGLTALLTFFLLVDKMDFSNFLPIFELPVNEYIQSTHIFTAVPFGEAVILLMLSPQMTEHKKLTRYVVGGAGAAAFIFLVVVIRNTVTLGPSVSIYAQTLFHSIRLIDVGEFLTRIEVLIALVITTALFIKISVLYFATVKSMASLFRVQSYSSLILPIGSIVVAVSYLTFEATVIHAEWGSKYAAAFTTPFTVILPAITLLIAKLRKLPK